MLRLPNALLLAAFLAVAGACTDSKSSTDKKASQRDACEHANEACADEARFELDCDDLQDLYDNSSDEKKAEADEQIRCIMSEESCDAVTECLGEGADGSANTKPTEDAGDEEGE